MAEEKKEEGAEGEAPPKKGKKKLVIIAVLVLVLVLGGASFMLLGGKKADGEGGEAEEEHHEEVHLQLAKLDTFIVNLSENTAFLKVAMLLEYDPSMLHPGGDGHGGGGGGYGGGGAGGGEAAPGPGPLPPEVAPREPMIRDSIIRVLSSKTSGDLLSPDGKDKLKEELIDAINEVIGLPEGPIVNIYFTEFLIQ